MLVRNTFEGFLGTHVCQYCKTVDPFPTNIAKIAHYKKRTFDTSLEFSSYLSQYTPALQKMISASI